MKPIISALLIVLCMVLFAASSAWSMADDSADRHAGGIHTDVVHAKNQRNYQRELLAIEHQWAHINYNAPESERRKAFASLLEQANALSRRYPDQAGAMAWSAVVLYHYAGEVGGLEALEMVKKAHRILLRAEAINPTVENGLIYTALGLLYYRVPGWPIGFGDDAKAEAYLRKAIAIHPDALDANYFMGDYLLHQKHYRQAARYLRHALQAPPRAQFPIADAGRKADALDLLHQVEHHLK